MGFLKKALKGVNKAVNKVGAAASKVVSTAANVVGKVGNIPVVNMIPGMGTITNIAKTAGKVAGAVGNVIASGQSARGSSPPAMAQPPQQFAKASAQAAWDASVNIGGVKVSAGGGGTIKAAQQQEQQTKTIAKTSWFAKNKIVVFISSAVAVLVGVLAFVFRRKKGRGSNNW